MPFNGSGGFTRNQDWTRDASTGVKIRADLHDDEDDNFAAGLSSVITKNGETQPTGNLPLNNHRWINCQDPVDPQDYATKHYVDSVHSFNAPVTITGADANGRINFTGTQGPLGTGAPLGIGWTQADLFFGVKPVDVPTAGQKPRFVWNSNAGGTGTDLMTLDDTGTLNLAGDIHITGTAHEFIYNAVSANAGIITFKRNRTTTTAGVAGDNLWGFLFNGRDTAAAERTFAQVVATLDDPTAATPSGKMTLGVLVNGAMVTRVQYDKDGVLLVGNNTNSGTFTYATSLISSTATVNVATTGAGTINLRPNGVGSATGMVTLSSTGAMTIPGQITANGGLTSTGTITADTFTCGIGGQFNSADGTLRVGPGVSGQILLRPSAGTSAQISITPTVINAPSQDLTIKSVTTAAGGTISSGPVTSTGASSFGTLSAATITATSGMTTGASGLFSSVLNMVIGSSGAGGQIILRPESGTTGQMLFTGTTISAAAQDATFKSVTATGGASSFGSATFVGTFTIGPGGGITTLGGTQTNLFAAYVAGSSTRGATILDGGTTVQWRSNASVNTAVTHMAFANLTNGQVGSITTNGTATAFNVSSDAVLKNVIGPYDPLAAIAIIRADPVQDFTFKTDGSYAVGWVAQHSYTVSADLATPGNDLDPTDPEFQPWGVDQSKRTPYLWAALTWALDQIDALTARVTTLEGASA